MKLATRLFGQTYTFKDVKEVLAKANEPRSGDVLAGIAAQSAQERIAAKERPIVVITSNNEKELPDAFLRRCFFHYIKFPDRDTMQRIVDVHFPGIKQALLKEALEVFFGLREIPGLKKKPSTSELIDWLKLLVAEEIPVEALRSPDQKASIPPLHGALLKNEQDMHLFERLVFMAQRNR